MSTQLSTATWAKSDRATYAPYDPTLNPAETLFWK